MVVGEIKLLRVPVGNVKCEDCKRDLPFGAWAHYQADSKKAICIECGVKRGWSDKDRAVNIIKKRELQEDIKALRKRQKIEADALYLLREQVDLHRFGERYLDLERQIHALMDTVQSFVDKVATPQEKDALQKVYKAVGDTQALQKVIQEELESRLFLLERSERRKKYVQKIIDDAEAEEEQEVEAPAE
jgi:hypothetical protein